MRGPAATLAIGSACAALATVMACSGPADAPGSKGVVQFVDMITRPTTGECAGQFPPGTQALYHVEFQIHMVNTTDEDVTIQTVSSTGQVVRATRANEVGLVGHTFTSIPFTPSTVLRAHDGDVTLTATMTAGCGLIDLVPGEEFYRDIQTTVYVTTSAGQFASEPIAIHVTWRAFT